jgi:ribosomal protein L7/L12
MNEELPPEAVAALSQGRTIEAIKRVREARKIGLKEAKDAVDQYLSARPELKRKLAAAQAEARRGFLRWAVLLALAIGAAYYFLRSK